MENMSVVRKHLLISFILQIELSLSGIPLLDDRY